MNDIAAQYVLNLPTHNIVESERKGCPKNFTVSLKTYNRAEELRGHTHKEDFQDSFSRFIKKAFMPVPPTNIQIHC